MEETLISYETAVLARQKGFAIESAQFYGRVFPHSDFKRVYNTEQFRDIADFSSWAPTQSLLQKWLREEHQIFIDIGTEISGGSNRPLGLGYCLEVMNRDTNGDSPERYLFFLYQAPYFATYEEALEKGLKAALESI